MSTLAILFIVFFVVAMACWIAIIHNMSTFINSSFDNKRESLVKHFIFAGILGVSVWGAIITGVILLVKNYC